MGARTGSHRSGDLQLWLQQARAGSGESLEQLLGACREYLLPIAVEELRARPDSELDVQDLVGATLREVAGLPSTLDGDSDGELRDRLRQILLGRLQALIRHEDSTGAPANPGDSSIRDQTSAKTPEIGESKAAAASAASARGHDRAAFAVDGGSVGGLQTAPEKDGTAPDRYVDLFLAGMPQLEGFEQLSVIGNGGMGVVYRAWQTRMERWVALKRLPPEFAEDPDRLRRFHQEGKVAGGLAEHGIVHVYDVLQTSDTPVLVLSFVDGCDLNKIVSDRRRLRDGKEVEDPHPTALASASAYVALLLPFFDRVLDALVSLHGAGVLHRDLKPSNILVDKNGHGWLTDFGLARYNRSDSPAEPRQAMGTCGFMSPEQWSGIEDVDARTDLFGMGVTIYQALTLDFPYGKAPISAATTPAQLSKTRQRYWPANLDLVILKAIHPDREQRYQSAADFRDDWQRVRKGLLPQKAPVVWKRRTLHIVRNRTIQAMTGMVGMAVCLAVLLAALREKPVSVFSRTVEVTTRPPGARVALIPLREEDGRPQFEKAIEPREKTPVTIPRVRPGDYLVVVEVANHGFHEVYRRVPDKDEQVPALVPFRPETIDPNRQKTPNGVIAPGASGLSFAHLAFEERYDIIHLPMISVPKDDVSQGMVLFQGDDFTMGNAEYGPVYTPPHIRTVESFYLDTTEVTVASYRAVRKDIPEALRRLRPRDEDPVCLVAFDQAVRCAEEMGKRLPDEVEYEYAATNRGKTRFPWGDDFNKIESWPFGPAGSPAYDKTASEPAVRGLFSNVAEWTMSRHAPYPGVEWPADVFPFIRNQRIVRGGPFCVVKGNAHPQGDDKQSWHWDARDRQGIDRDKVHPGLGFRCARSFKPRFPRPSADKQ